MRRKRFRRTDSRARLADSSCRRTTRPRRAGAVPQGRSSRRRRRSRGRTVWLAPLDVEAVLDTERHALERQCPCTRPLFDLFRSGQQLIAGTVDNEVPSSPRAAIASATRTAVLVGRTGAPGVRRHDLGYGRPDGRTPRVRCSSRNYDASCFVTGPCPASANRPSA